MGIVSELAEKAAMALDRRWTHPGDDYRGPVPTGVVELGDWASEHLPDLIAELKRLDPGTILEVTDDQWVAMEGVLKPLVENPARVLMDMLEAARASAPGGSES